MPDRKLCIKVIYEELRDLIDSIDRHWRSSLKKNELGNFEKTEQSTKLFYRVLELRRMLPREQWPEVVQLMDFYGMTREQALMLITPDRNGRY